MEIPGVHLSKGALGMGHVVNTEGGTGDFTTVQVLVWEAQNFKDH